MYTSSDLQHNADLFNAIDILNRGRRMTADLELGSRLTRAVKYLVDQLICK